MMPTCERMEPNCQSFPGLSMSGVWQHAEGKESWVTQGTSLPTLLLELVLDPSRERAALYGPLLFFIAEVGSLVFCTVPEGTHVCDTWTAMEMLEDGASFCSSVYPSFCSLFRI